MNIDEEIKRVSDKIIECNEAYQKGERLIDDAEYDQMIEWLRHISPNHPLVSKVQNDVKNTDKQKFDFGGKPMLSLNKVYSTEDLIKWMRSVSRDDNEKFLLQPKYDGLSGCISGGISRIFSTRGDGHFGEIINSKIPMIKIDRWTTDYSGDIDSLTGTQTDFFFPDNSQIRGEIIINRGKFDILKSAVKKKDGEEYKNTRNAVSGLMNPNSSIKDDYITSEKLKKAGISISFISHDEISKTVCISDENLAEEIEKTWNFYLKMLPYDQDGLVIKLKDRNYADSLGNTEHHPRGACALKASNNENTVDAEILSISWFVGMQGELTPVYNIVPTEIGGTTVSNILGHNMKNLQDNDVKIGDFVKANKAGMVIPFAAGYRKGPNHSDLQFYSNIGLDSAKGIGYAIENDAIMIGDNEYLACPCCGRPVIYDPIASPDCYCINEHCHDRVMKRLYNAVSKCFDIKGLAEETLEKMNQKYKVEKFYQLLDLSVEQLSMLPGFAMKSAEILFDSIQKSRKCDEIQVLASLGIKFIGRRVAQDALSVMPLLRLRDASLDDLMSIPNFGPEKAKSLYEGLRKYQEELDELLARVESKRAFSETKIAENSGRTTICFTGKAPFERSYCQQLAKRNGYEPVSGVTKGLGILVCADTDTNSSKARKARNYGTKIIGFTEWFNSLEDKGEEKPIESDNAIHNGMVDEIIGNL